MYHEIATIWQVHKTMASSPLIQWIESDGQDSASSAICETVATPMILSF